MKVSDQAIEAAARAGAAIVTPNSHLPWEQYPIEERDGWREYVRPLVEAAAPYIARAALRDWADGADMFAAEVYPADVFIPPTPDDYKQINDLLQRERGHMLDPIAADLYRHAIGVQAQRAREEADEIKAGLPASRVDIDNLAGNDGGHTTKGTAP